MGTEAKEVDTQTFTQLLCLAALVRGALVRSARRWGRRHYPATTTFCDNSARPGGWRDSARQSVCLNICFVFIISHFITHLEGNLPPEKAHLPLFPSPPFALLSLLGLRTTTRKSVPPARLEFDVFRMPRERRSTLCSLLCSAPSACCVRRLFDLEVNVTQTPRSPVTDLLGRARIERVCNRDDSTSPSSGRL